LRTQASSGVTLVLSSSLQEVRGIGPRRAADLAKEGKVCVEDLLLTLPMRYEDRRLLLPLGDLPREGKVTVWGSIRSARLRRTRVRGFTIFDVVLADSTSEAAAIWYNQPYLGNVLKVGSQVVLFGEATLPEKGPRRPLFKNPEFELLAADPEGIHMGRIVPVYRRAGGLSPRALRSLIHRILSSLTGDLPEPLPASLVGSLHLEERGLAFRRLHFPDESTPLPLLASRKSASHRRFALEELYALQRRFARSRRLREGLEAQDFTTSRPARETLKSSAPFALTLSQARALDEILDDLARNRPMRRLLLGDVGCGKTLVVLLAIRAVMDRGGQAAFMVPTEILAEQHHRLAARLLSGAGRVMALLTSRTSWEVRRATLSGLASGEIGLVVGTHALIQETVRFKSLGLVVVDEQHRFGVRQRELLRAKGAAPHQLFLTATPIPRSLAHAFYGDLDVTRIEEMPPGRHPVKTFLKPPSARHEIDRLVRQEVEGGGRVAIVLPAIAARGSTLDASVLETYKRVSAGVFSDLGVGLLHGRLDPEERERTLQEFSGGALRVLVATTVVEVGLDVPEASGVVIESAERFGLSQLHQIRGRVGRGSRPSWCILVPAAKVSAEALARLRILTEISDGFEIAKRDLDLRGAGELMGFRQSGIPDLRVANLTRDLDLLEIARDEAFRIYANTTKS